MKTERLPWFPCYPSKLLSALTGMPGDVKLVYLLVLLRIYEDGGSVAEDRRTLALRAAISSSRCQKALDELITTGRLIMQDDKLINPVAEEHIRAQNKIHRERVEQARTAAGRRWKKDEQNQTNIGADSMREHSILDLDKDLEKKVRKSALGSAPKGSRIDVNWKPSVEEAAYGKSRGLTEREVQREAEKFVNYWRSTSGQKGVKSDWLATWRNWCISSAERLGRQPVVLNGKGQTRALTPDEWKSVLRVFGATSNWPGPGPKPGSPGCLVPPELLQGNLV
jgi:uncharacterized protein YdaU (DUF1376 family)